MFSIRFDEILQIEGKDELEDGELPVTNSRQDTGSSKPPAEHEIDHNVCICCGTFNAASEHEKECDVEKADGD